MPDTATIDPAILATRSGLEIMRAIASGALPMAPMARNMQLAFDLVEEGRVSVSASPRAEHVNPMGTTHGGWFGTILDTALGCAVMSALPVGRGYTTLEYRVNLIRALAPGVPVVAEARVDHLGRSTGIAHARMTGAEDGRLYATASTTCLVMAHPSGD